jgi:hypothetical protein
MEDAESQTRRWTLRDEDKTVGAMRVTMARRPDGTMGADLSYAVSDDAPANAVQMIAGKAINFVAGAACADLWLWESGCEGHSAIWVRNGFQHQASISIMRLNLLDLDEPPVVEPGGFVIETAGGREGWVEDAAALGAALTERRRQSYGEPAASYEGLVRFFGAVDREQARDIFLAWEGQRLVGLFAFRREAAEGSGLIQDLGGVHPSIQGTQAERQVHQRLVSWAWERQFATLTVIGGTEAFAVDSWLSQGFQFVSLWRRYQLRLDQLQVA